MNYFLGYYPFYGFLNSNGSVYAKIDKTEVMKDRDVFDCIEFSFQWKRYHSNI